MWKRLGLMVVGVLVGWVILEVGLRQLGTRVDPMARNEWMGCVGWAGRPYQVQKYFTDEFSTTERINSAGLPDVEHTYARPPNTYRILFIGDSFIEAYQVDLEESFPRLLEERLNAGRAPGVPTYEVIKAGYRSWGTDQAWQYYACEGYHYRADLVVYAFSANDVMDNSLPLKAQMANWDPETPPKPYYTLDEHGRLVVHNFPYPPASLEVRSRSVRDFLYKHLVGNRTVITGSLTIADGGLPRADIVNANVDFYNPETSDRVVPLGGTLAFTLTVENYGDIPIRTIGPNSGYHYRSDENFNTAGDYQSPGAWRIGIDYEGNPSYAYPYRWALGSLDDLEARDIAGQTFYYLMPGKRVVVTGSIQIVDVPANRDVVFFWAGLIHEEVSIDTFNDYVDPQQISIGF